MEEHRPLSADEWAILDWFFDQWPELEALENALPQDRVAEVFSAEDGYRTLTLELQHPAAACETPFPGEAVADVEGRHFNAMLFTRDTTLMLELIWGTEWPGRLPTAGELRPVWSEATPNDD